MTHKSEIREIQETHPPMMMMMMMMLWIDCGQLNVHLPMRWIRQSTLCFNQGLKRNFKVVETEENPWSLVKICGPLSILRRAPCISSQAVILIKFRSTSSLENFSSNNILHIPASKSEAMYRKLSFRPWNVHPHRKKAILEAWECHTAEMAAFPCVCTHFNFWFQLMPRFSRWVTLRKIN